MNSSDNDKIHPAEGAPTEAVLQLRLLPKTLFYFGNLGIIISFDVEDLYVKYHH